MARSDEAPMSGFRALGETLGRWLFGRRIDQLEPEASNEPLARFRTVCISREAGAGGGTLGRLLAQRLGWTLYDDELLETIARRMEVHVDEVQALDELSPSIVQDWFLPLREEHYAPLEAYLDHLAKLVLSIGKVGDAVIVGRGAGFMLPRNETLTVRVVAPLKVRAARLAERLGVTQRTARRLARDLDRRRDKFLRTMFRVNAHDPHEYDLMLDTESLGFPIAVELLARAVEVGQPTAIDAERTGGQVALGPQGTAPPWSPPPT